MVDSELILLAKQLREALAAVGPLEHVALLDLLPGKRTNPLRHLVPESGKFLFPGEKLLAGLKPLVSVHDVVLHHLCLRNGLTKTPS